jgi:hypothetical protein
MREEGKGLLRGPPREAEGLLRSLFFTIPPLPGRNSPLKSRNVSLIYYFLAGFG